jgi:hypothetical protein
MKSLRTAIYLISLLCVLHAAAEVKTPQERENTYPDGPIAQAQAAAKEAEKNKPCESFKEFQSAYEGLMKDSDLALGEEKAARLSLKISKGCNGSANRFFKAY